MIGTAHTPEFSEVYQAHFEYAWACLRRLGVPPEAQEDAVQDLFVVVYRQLPAFAGRSSLKTWIFGVARKVAGRYRRTEARRLRRHERLATTLASEPADAGEDVLLRREARRLLARFLDELDDDRRPLFVLHIYEDLSGPEIAEVLGLNLNTVYSRLRLIRAQFDRTFAAHRERALLVARTPEQVPEDAQRRIWAMLVAPVGGAATTTAGLGATTGKLMGVPWLVGIVGGAALVVVVATPPSGDRPEAEVTAKANPQIVEPTAPRPAPAPLADPIPAPAAPKKLAPRRAVPPTPIGPPPTAEALAAETALMARVRAAIDAGRADEALGLTAEHARDYPQGVLQRERQGFRAIALCTARQMLAGRDEAARFLDQYPETALAVRLRAACELATP